MDIKDLTIGQVQELKELLNLSTTVQTLENNSHPYEIGKNYLIRTVTMANTGRLIAVYPQELVLENAAWIADTGRFADCLINKDVFNEVEPFKSSVIIGRGSIIDATQIDTLPTKQK